MGEPDMRIKPSRIGRMKKLTHFRLTEKIISRSNLGNLLRELGQDTKNAPRLAKRSSRAVGHDGGSMSSKAAKTKMTVGNLVAKYMLPDQSANRSPMALIATN
jgi:hypothetical protein